MASKGKGSKVIDKNYLNGKACTLEEICEYINSKPLIIPSIQRNYKWDSGSDKKNSTAVKLAHDLLNSYQSQQNKPKTLAMITLYDDNDRIQLLDGQQRFITLSLIFRYLGKKPFDIKFERDANIADSRSDFICRMPQTLDGEQTAFSDKRRLMYNYENISKKLEEGAPYDKDDLYRYIMKNVQMLVHITQTPPIEEFLNLNTHKTRFSVCDRVRSALIIHEALYPPKDEHESRQKNIEMLENEDYITGISHLFEALTRELYDTGSEKNDDFYKLVSSNYCNPDNSNENRLNIVTDRFAPVGEKINYFDIDEEKLSAINDNADKEDKKDKEDNAITTIKKLVFFLHQLHSLKMDKHNVRGIYKTLAGKFKYTRFFEVIEKFYTSHADRTDSNTLSDILHERCSAEYALFRYITESTGMESQLIMVNRYFQLDTDGKPPENSELENTLNIPKKKHEIMDEMCFKNVISNAGKYLLRRYHEEKKTAEADVLLFGAYMHHDLPMRGNITPQLAATVNIGELLFGDDTNYIIEIPVIQRDYCMGSHLSDNGFINYLSNCYENNSPVTLSAITVNEAKGALRIFDGQQRIVTLSAILAVLGELENTRSILFEHRDEFTEQLADFRKNGSFSETKQPRSYSEQSLMQVSKQLDKLTDKNGFAEYLRTNVSVAVVKLEDNPDIMEQYFIDINGGVALKPYEIFKSMLNQKCAEEFSDTVSVFPMEWRCKIDNSWLDYFYKFIKPEKNNESSKEELIEMQFIEYCLRMIYWDHHDANSGDGVKTVKMKGFSTKDSSMGDSAVFIEALNKDDFRRIAEIMDKIVCIDISKVTHCQLTTKKPTDDSIIFDSKNATPALMLKCFIKDLIEGSCDNDRKLDRILWWILNGENITDCIAYWNKQNQLKEPIVIAESSKYNFDHVLFELKKYDTFRFIPKYYCNNDRLFNLLKEKGLIDFDKIYEMLSRKSADQTIPIITKRRVLYKYLADNQKLRATSYYTESDRISQLVKIGQEFLLRVDNDRYYSFCFTQKHNIKTTSGLCSISSN